MKTIGKICASAMMMLVGFVAYADTIGTEEIEILETEVSGRTWRYYIVVSGTDGITDTQNDALNALSGGGASSTTIASSNDSSSSYAIITGVTPADGDIVIPSNLPVQNGTGTRYYTVAGIADRAFKDCSELTNVSMDESASAAMAIGSQIIAIGDQSQIIAIGDQVFENCTSLTNVSMRATSVAIGRKVFRGCTSLEHILLSNSLLSRLGNKVINSYDELRTYHYWSSTISPKRLCNINESFFVDELTEPMDIGLFDAVNQELVIESYEQGCKISVELKETEIDGRIWRYYVRTTSQATALDQWGTGGISAAVVLGTSLCDGAVILGVTPASGMVTIPDTIDGYTVVGVGDNAFNNCAEMTGITLPGSIGYIGSWAFYNCKGLTEIDAPFTDMGDGAFYGCDNLNRIRIPAECDQKIPQIWPSYTVSSASSSSTWYETANEQRLWQDEIDKIGVEIKQAVPLVAPTKDNFTVVLTSGGNDVVSIAINGDEHIATMLGAYDKLGSWGGRPEPSYTQMLYSGISEAYSDWGALITSIAIDENVGLIGHGFFDDFPKLEEVVIPNTVEHIVPKCSTNQVDVSFAERYWAVCARMATSETNTYLDIDSYLDAYYYSVSVGFSLPYSYFPPHYDDFYYVWTSPMLPASVANSLLRWLVMSTKSAFEKCNNLKKLTIPQCVCSTNINDVFLTAKKTVTEVTIADGVTHIDDLTFEGWSNLQKVIIPASVTRIGANAFKDCGRLETIIFEGDAPDVSESAFIGTPRSMVLEVAEGTVGWDGGFTGALPEVWNGRRIVAMGSSGGVTGGGTGSGDVIAPAASEVYLTVTNVVVHYVTNSQVSGAVTPALEGSEGLVNVIAEVSAGGPVAMTKTWAEQYEGFEEKFGNDFAAAITKETGKRDGAGNVMRVWQDFVAGTDPTDEDDVFKASITFDEDGNTVISWTPELTEEEAEKRVYRKYGKVKLNDKDWTEIQDGHEGDYNFFKVSVEMK